MATVKFTLDPRNPPKMSEETKAFFDTLADSEIEAMAGDPNEGVEAPDDEMLKRGVTARLIRQTREALQLTQEAFAQRFHLPMPALRDWEAGRTMPDEAMAAYLQVIAREPAAVARALAAA